MSASQCASAKISFITADGLIPQPDTTQELYKFFHKCLHDEKSFSTVPCRAGLHWYSWSTLTSSAHIEELRRLFQEHHLQFPTTLTCLELTATTASILLNFYKRFEFFPLERHDCPEEVVTSEDACCIDSLLLRGALLLCLIITVAAERRLYFKQKRGQDVNHKPALGLAMGFLLLNLLVAGKQNGYIAFVFLAVFLSCSFAMRYHEHYNDKVIG